MLSRVADFPGLAGKWAPVDKVRDLYRRVQRSPEGFGLESLLAEMRVGLNVWVRSIRRGFPRAARWWS